MKRFVPAPISSDEPVFDPVVPEIRLAPPQGYASCLIMLFPQWTPALLS